MSDAKTRIIQSSGAPDCGVRLNDTYEIEERIGSGAEGEFGIDFAYFRLSR